MKKLSIIILIIFLASNNTNACTTFVIKEAKNLLFCRNYDYDLGSGFITINKRGIEKQAIIFTGHQPARWVSQYGSVTFNQIGIDAPMEGMNEKGLVIAQMALPGSQYPQYNNGAVLNQLEWIQYQLDNSVLLADVIENNKKVHIVPIATPVHYFVCDSLGNIGVFEFLNGEIIIYKGDEVTIPVCSNMFYDSSKVGIKDYDGFGGQKPLPHKWKNVEDIIAIANSRIDLFSKNGKENPIEYCFKTLSLVGSPERTQWSVVYDIKNMKIHFRSMSNKNIRTINFYDFNYECKNDIQVFDIQTSENSISIKSQFFTLSKEYYYTYKKGLIHWFKNNVEGFPDIPNVVIKEEAEYVFLRDCRKN